MTISIKITNADSRENAIVKVGSVHRGDKSMLPCTANMRELKGGESADLYVHDGQSLIVEEVQNG